MEKSPLNKSKYHHQKCFLATLAADFDTRNAFEKLSSVLRYPTLDVEQKMRIPFR